MMANKAKALYYVTESSLIIQTEKSVLASISFPDTIIKNKEVIDKEGFVDLLTSEIKATVKKASTAVILLGDGILSQSSVNNGGEQELAREALLSSLPYPKEDIAEKTISTGKKAYLLATNRQYYETILEVAKNLGIEIFAVCPFTLFSDSEVKGQIPAKEAKLILEKQDLYTVGDFLESNLLSVSDSEESEKKEEITHAKQEVKSAPNENVSIESQSSDVILTSAPYQRNNIWNTSRLLILLGFVIILTVLMGGLIYLQSRHTPVANISDEQEAKPTEAPTPTEVQSVQKSELNVEIQNGSGTPGQAGRVKTLLEGIDYTTIETTNADTTDYTQTEVVFSTKVSSDQQQEIKTLLLETFTAVTTKTDAQADVDILIITGTEKE